MIGAKIPGRSTGAASGSVQKQGATVAFGREALFHQVGPLIGGTLMGLLFLAAASVPAGGSGLILRAGVITTLTVMLTAALPWDRLPSSLKAGPPLMYLLAAFLLGRATGGSNSVYEQLVLLPILWLAVYASGFELAVGLVATSAALIGPALADPRATQAVMRALMLTALASILGYSMHRILEQIRAATGRLDVLARTDDLTGVANRRAWDEYLEIVLERARIEGFPVSVAILDVDHFKEFNDQFGHQAGDLFLKEITARWRNRLRDTDVLARLGGDEFAVVLPNCEPRSAYSILERLAVDAPSGNACSGGLASWDGTETTFELIARADQALYRAKNDGRGRVMVAGPSSPVPA